ncbi:PASTA domain-containing protein [Nocardia asiatica]|uniref:PASTA domain-containing protein n=1 Tax=Nocardia asiatica TaxID=209252 RepID=UPI002458634C|nr:PASTA domain-containing protein [Nocardia asiatica]
MKKKTPAYVWIIIAVVALCGLGIVGSAISGTDKDKDAAQTTSRAIPTTVAAAPAAPASTSIAPVVSEVAIPNVIGKNGAIAADELKRAGFTKISYGSATPGVQVVVMPANWTVTAIEPGPGTVLPLDAMIVLTMTKNNR